MKNRGRITLGLIVSLLLFSCTGNTKSSSKLGETTTESRKDSTRFTFGFIADNKYIILSANADTVWRKGTPVLSKPALEGAYSAVTDVDMQMLPPTYLELLQSSVKILNGNGETCIAKVKSLKLLAEYIPHFVQVQIWKGTDYNSSEEQYLSRKPKNTDDQMALEIWKSAGQYMLVAEFDLKNKILSEPLSFALPSDKPVAIFQLCSESKMTREKSKIDSIVSQMKDYAIIQQEFSKNPEKLNKNWWKDKESSESFTFFQASYWEGYATVSHSSGNACGGDFYAEKYSVWKIDKNSLPTLLYITDHTYTTLLAIDSDNDSIPEFLIDDGRGSRFLLKKIGGEWTRCYSWTIPYHNDPC